MPLTRDDLYQALQTELGLDTSTIQDDTLLFSSGIIDSFSLVSLIVFIEARGGVKIDAMDVNLDNLDSIDRILKFVNRASSS